MMMTQDEFVIGDRVEYTGHGCIKFIGNITLINENKIHIQADGYTGVYEFDFNPINIKKYDRK